MSSCRRESCSSDESIRIEDIAQAGGACVPITMKEEEETLQAHHRTAAERIQQACPLFFAALYIRVFQRSAMGLAFCGADLPVCG